MSYEQQAYENEHGDPVIVLVATGTHDVSRLVNLFSHGNSEQVGVRDQLAKQLRRRNRGRAALRLLKQHGGPDLLEGPVDDFITGDEALRLPLGSIVRWRGDRTDGGLRIRNANGWEPPLGAGTRPQYLVVHDASEAS